MNINTEKQKLSGIFKELADDDDITTLLRIADSIAGGLPALAASMPTANQPQLFKLIPTCPCETCSTVTLQGNPEPSESILSAFLRYVKVRLVIMEGQESGRKH